MMTETAVESPRILVVDDQMGMRLSLKGILTKRGYTVAVAEDGVQALEMARQTEYRLILMDIKMPGLSGVETFIKIKAFSPHTTVIMMTAFAAEDEIRLAIQEGAYAIISKPFAMEQMLAIIKECLDKRTLVLIVDDQLESANLLKDIFEKRGYRVCVVDSGEECLKEVSQRRYQVILLDIKLPGIDGVETLRRVKELRPDVCVIMMTGCATEDLIEKALRKDSFACVRKPFDIDNVLQVINRCLQEERGANPSDD